MNWKGLGIQLPWLNRGNMPESAWSDWS